MRNLFISDVFIDVAVVGSQGPYYRDVDCPRYDEGGMDCNLGKLDQLILNSFLCVAAKSRKIILT